MHISYDLEVMYWFANVLTSNLDARSCLLFGTLQNHKLFQTLDYIELSCMKFCSKCIPEASTKRNNSFECLCCERKRKICTFAKKASNLSISRNLMSYIFSSFAFAYQDED